MRDELLKGLSEEQIKKAKECKSPEEILALAKAEGIELNDEQLEAVSGGGCNKERKSSVPCQKCGSADVTEKTVIITTNTGGATMSKTHRKCNSCGHTWFANN